MLSIANVSAGGQAASYYEEKDDYYTRDSEHAALSYWSGAGAAALNLHGEVSHEQFQAVLKGELPNGSKIAAREGQRRGGSDLTFSAPKSVSLQALVSGDTRVIDAHARAVRRTLEYAETMAKARNGETTGNLIIASFTHALSRNVDPQLHTHNIVINATQRSDGAWRATQNKWLYELKMQLGAMYRSELARELQSLGYEIRRTHGDGRFELAGYADAQLKAFSTRSADIERALAERGLNRANASAELKKTATKATRVKKKDVDRGVLRAVWREKARSLGVAIDARPRVVNRAPVEAPAREAVEFAIQHLAEREAVFDIHALRRHSLERAVGQATLGEVNAAIAEAVSNRRLFQRDHEFTTHEGLFREQDILRINAVGRNAFTRGMASLEAVEAHLSNTRLNDGQKAAVRLIGTSKDRVVGIQGRAGTGKTTMLAELKSVAERSGFKVMGLGPSGRAANELRDVGIESMTIAKFLATKDRGVNANTLVLLDESSMVSARDMRYVLKEIESTGARVALIGDERQLKAVEAGRPFQQLKEVGMRFVEMSEIQRQKNTLYRDAVTLTAEGNIHDALKKIAGNIREVKDDHARYCDIAAGYAALSPEDRKSTMIVSGTNDARQWINDYVRAELGLNGQEFRVLRRVDLTTAQAAQADHYRVGQVVEAERKYPGIKKGERFTVASVNTADNTVELRRADGSVVSWNPWRQSQFSAYREESMRLAVGDKIQFTKGTAGYANRDYGEIVGIDRNSIAIRLQNGRTVTIDASRALHIDYGYASTIHSAQGATVDRVIADLNTKTLTTNDSSFYVALSRGRRALRIYTNNAAALPDAIARRSQKRAALELTEKRQKQEERVR
ncbi:conjugative relaxase [Methylocaldum sp. BRCS4]|nr:conjugative relaxase [Methylocaldum sp. BRCS4]